MHLSVVSEMLRFRVLGGGGGGGGGFVVPRRIRGRREPLDATAETPT